MEPFGLESESEAGAERVMSKKTTWEVMPESAKKRFLRELEEKELVNGKEEVELRSIVERGWSINANKQRRRHERSQQVA
jgi:hypothetical protein